jgi:hypothetical protein
MIRLVKVANTYLRQAGTATITLVGDAVAGKRGRWHVVLKDWQRMQAPGNGAMASPNSNVRTLACLATP